MPLRPFTADQPPLGVGWMALALLLAAFLGGGLGLIWQSTGFGAAGDADDAAVDVQPVDSAAG